MGASFQELCSILEKVHRERGGRGCRGVGLIHRTKAHTRVADRAYLQIKNAWPQLSNFGFSAAKMSKFLRQIEFRGFLRQATYDETESNLLEYFKPHPNYLTGVWAYARQALPVSCEGVAKINFYGCENLSTRCDVPCLNIGSMWVEVPPAHGLGLTECASQQSFMVELAHRGAHYASKQYNFALEPFETAKELIIRNHYRYEYQIGKSKTSPDRRTTALIWCYFDDGFKTELVLQDRNKQEVNRIHFARTNETIVTDLSWTSSRTIRVSTKNFNDSYWLCTTEGTVEFHFGLADSDSAHHVYRNACILIDGSGVIPDRERGMLLLERAAAMGYKHAQRRLGR